MEKQKLRTISIDDAISFKYNNDVFRECFGSSRTAAYGQYAGEYVEDGAFVWFPKGRIFKGGEWKPGSSEVNWKNHIEDGGRTIIMELNPDEKAKDTKDDDPDVSKRPEPHYTFFQNPGEDYKYVGTFIKDVKASAPKHQVYRRVATRIDLSAWADGINFSYINDSNTGVPSLKRLYIDKNYKKQKDRIANFLDSLNPAEFSLQYEEAVIKFSEKYNLFSLISMTQADFASTFVPEFISFCNAFWGELKEEELAQIYQLTPQDVGQLLSSSHDTDKLKIFTINEIIANSEIDSSIAGKIFAAFDKDQFLYGLSEMTARELVKRLNLDTPDDADIVLLHSLLYFWKGINPEMEFWSAAFYYSFLCFVFGMNCKIFEDIRCATEYNPIVNEAQLHKAMTWFVKYVVTNQTDSVIDFNGGFIAEQEGYKKAFFEAAHKMLEIDSWDREMCGSGIIFDCVKAAMQVKDENHKTTNIIDYHDVTKFTEAINADLRANEEILFDLYKSENPERAFNHACEKWGKWFPLLSYLMYMRDMTCYVPVKTSNHSSILNKLYIDSDCLNLCSWGNYLKFLQIVNAVRIRLESYLGTSLSMIDAHSFLWMLKNAPDNFTYKDGQEDATIENALSQNDDPLESIVIRGEKEGRVVAYYGKKYERNPKNRADAIRIHGYKCMACGFDFQETYGPLGKDFIEVHHSKPLYSLSEEVIVNPETDLVCLCANCHRMIHRKRGEILSLEELKGQILKSIAMKKL